MSAWSCVDSGAVAALALGEEFEAWSAAEGVRGLRGAGPVGRVEPSRCSTTTRCLPRQPHGSAQGNAEKKPSNRPVAAPMSHRDRLGLAFKLDPDKAVVLASHLSLMPLPLRRV